MPDYAIITGDTTVDVSTNPITGLSDVTYTYTVTSHWSSLAVLRAVIGQLTKELTTDDTVVDSLTRLFTGDIKIVVSALCNINVCMLFLMMCMPC